MEKLFSFKFKDKPQHLRRISIKPDKDRKSRPFAIVDYITQSALTNLHDDLYAILKKIPQDCTFDQNQGVKDLAYGSHPCYYSFDLTAATDRFPIKLQEMVLTYLTSPAYSTAWVNAMVGTPFVLPSGRKISFNTGQPLGAKSSWALFTLSHHFVVQYCAMLLDIENPAYKLLGDDIVICDHRLAKLYLSIMTQLGVEISPIKTHKSTKLFEFAKRFFLDSVEISPFPLNALIEGGTNIPNLIQVLSGPVADRGWLPLFITSSTPHY